MSGPSLTRPNLLWFCNRPWSPANRRSTKGALKAFFNSRYLQRVPALPLAVWAETHRQSPERPTKNALPQPPTLEMLQDEVCGHFCKTEAVQRRLSGLSDVASCEWELNPYAELTAVALGLPGIKPTGAGTSNLDAVADHQAMRWTAARAACYRRATPPQNVWVEGKLCLPS